MHQHPESRTRSLRSDRWQIHPHLPWGTNWWSGPFEPVRHLQGSRSVAVSRDSSFRPGRRANLSESFVVHTQKRYKTERAKWNILVSSGSTAYMELKWIIGFMEGDL